MKTRYLWTLAASILLVTTNSFAQHSENSNPYAIFGRTPYVAGEKDTGADAEKVFVIENFAKGSKVARIEHNPQTGTIKLFDKDGVLLATRQLTDNEKAWPTQDKKAEKYYSISPYAFCLNNPIRYIDPDGQDVWEMDYEGRVKWISESKEHTMHALNKKGEKTGQSITIQNRAIFDGLTSTGAANDYAASYAGGNPTELASVFLFGADNSNAEWRFSRYDIGGGDQYAIGTVHNDGLAISPEQMGFARENEVAFMHSHPGNYQGVSGPMSEQGSMGWAQHTLQGDSRNVALYSERYPSNRNSYVYFPNSGNIHQVRGVHVPAMIRNINNHNYNGRRLFWGILNGR